MKSLGFLLILALAIILSLPLRAGNVKNCQLIDKYSRMLGQKKTARDSVQILYNIFDLSDRGGQAKIAWELYETAGRANDLSAQMDMLRNLAVFYGKNDSVINVLQSMASRIPNRDARNATRTFISNQQFVHKSRFPGDAAYEQMLLDSISKSHDMMGDDRYDRLSLFCQIIHFLGVDAYGALFREAFDKYSKIVSELPASDYALKNQYYVTAAIIYTRDNQHSKAIECDLKLLEICDQLEEMNAKKQRLYRNYDINRFLCYRRILSNFDVLSPQQIEAVHDSMMYYYNNDPDVKAATDYDGQMDALYLMATKKYKEAIPMLQKALANPNLSDYQKIQYNDYLKEAAEAVGDTRTQIVAMEQARVFLHSIDSLRKVAAHREVAIREALSDKPIFREKQTADRSRIENSLREWKTTLTIISSVLAAMLLIYMLLYFKLRLKRTSH